MKSANFFEDGSPYLHHPLLTTERTAAEIDFLLGQFDLTAEARILDVGCGFGRHTIELARRGYTATGIDPSTAMIAAAGERTANAGIDGDFVCADGRTFTSKQPYDAAICLFTTFGQIVDRVDNRALVDNIAGILRSGGSFAVETPQRDAAVRALKQTERFGDNDTYTDIERRFDPAANVVTEQFQLVSPHSQREFILRYRLFSAAELTDLLDDAGFKIVARFADYGGAPLDNDSSTMLFIGQRT